MSDHRSIKILTGGLVWILGLAGGCGGVESVLIGSLGGDPVLGGGTLEGTWVGATEGRFTITSDMIGETSMEFRQDMTITFDAAGQPIGLPLLALGSMGGGSAGEVGEFEVGAVSEVVSEMELTGFGKITTTSVLRVIEADLSPNGLYIVYEQEMDQVGSTFSQSMSGTVTYEAEVNGDRLTWTQELDFVYEQRFGGMTQSGTQTGVLTGELSRR